MLGWLGIAGDVGEYGGKWVMKQGDLDALDDAVESSRVNLHDLYDVSIALSGQINDRIARIKKMEDIIKKDDELYPEYATLKKKQRDAGKRATRHAITRRDTDAAGDAEEKKKYHQEAARRGISAVTKPKVDPRPKSGVWGSSKKGGKY